MTTLTRFAIALVLSLPLIARADDPQAKAEIQQALVGMAAAALAADSDAYLSHIYTGDKEFLNEQKYFARDLKKKTPAEVRYELGEGEMKMGDGVASCNLTTIWTMPGKKERKVSFDAKFILEGGAWKYAGETWERHEAPGVIVMSDPDLDELAAHTVEAFNAIRAHVEEGFDLQEKALPKRVQQIKIYGSMRHLQESICFGYEDGLSGWNEPGEPIKLLADKRSSVTGLKRLLSHEYGHVATFELGPTANKMPWWALEGVAELSSQFFRGPNAYPDKAVKAWSKAGKLAPWNDMADFDTCPKQWMGHVYTQGHHMLGYISDKYGREKRNLWLTLMSNGKTIDEATQGALGMSWDALDKEWREALAIEPPEAEPADKKDEPKKDEPQKAEPKKDGGGR